MKLKKYVLAHLLISVPIVTALTMATTVALYVKDDANSGGSYGEIALRSYFDSGAGTLDSPYVITRPRHLYNLSRLQGLGLFSDPNRAFFQLGKKGIDSTYEYACYSGDYGEVTVPYLDMTVSTRQYEPINAIGSESTPFYGDFNGNGLEIKNLNVFADPQDAGLFGYTAHGSSVHDLFLDKITIHTMGYTAGYSGLYSNDGGVTHIVEEEGVEVEKIVDVAMGYYPSASSSSPTMVFDLDENNGNSKQETYDVLWNYFGDTVIAPTPSSIPYAGFSVEQNSGYKFKMLQSGSFLQTPVDDKCSVDFANVFSFFNEKVKESGKLYQFNGTSWVQISSVNNVIAKQTVADIAARDALEAENADVVEVTNSGDGSSKLYQYRGSSWVEVTQQNGLIAKLAVDDDTARDAKTSTSSRGDVIEVADSSVAITASSSVSLIASITDSYGLDHSRVLMSLTFKFTYYLGSSTITMDVSLGDEHGNNIGLVIGHCDGSVNDCYVHEGSFDMNGGGEAYANMENGSGLGLIGLVGGTVFNKAALDSDATSSAKKDKGSLDFTDIYDDIVIKSGANKTFDDNPTAYGTGVVYHPNTDSKYAKYLRSDGSTYVTKGNEKISFRGQTVIRENDLGIFTIATDDETTGMGEQDVATGLDKSMISREDLAVNGSYYLYYGTGEYKASLYGEGKTGSQLVTARRNAFGEYRASFDSDNPSKILLGHHFPNTDEISKESFEQREANQNYFIRMKLEPEYRKKHGNYFWDVDQTTPGGSFLSKYFANKLVDQNSLPVPAGTSKCGVQLLTSSRQQVSSLAASFKMPDRSDGTKMISMSQGGEITNTINFEIFTTYANVTVIAAPENPLKPAALGIYKIDQGDFISLDGGNYYINRDYDDPDYAFFMPREERLAYFEYEVVNGKGVVGVKRNGLGELQPATTSDNAIVPKTYVSDGNGGFTPYTESGYTAGLSRLYLHTFKLPTGRYCFGSPTGSNSSGDLGVAKVFFVCAQGQVDGQYGDDTDYASNDTVEDVDFLMQPRFTIDEETGRFTQNFLPNVEGINGERCYVALANSDRSIFAAGTCGISFVYEDSKFKITAAGNDLTYMTHVAVNNYRKKQLGDNYQNVLVSLFGQESRDPIIVYPTANTGG